MRSKEGPICPICARPVSEIEYICLSVEIVRFGNSTSLGVEHYHPECYMDRNEDGQQKISSQEQEQ